MSGQNFKVFWDEALKQIHDEYKKNNQEDTFKIWFKMVYESEDDSLNQINVSVPSAFMWDQMVNFGFIEKIQNKVFELSGQKILISHNISQNFTPVEEENDSPVYVSSKPVTFAESKSSENEPKIVRNHPQLNDKFTFDSFVYDDVSTFAYNVALAAAKNPGTAYNPILIYGGVGLGKTHLMQAIGNYIHKNDEDAKICYVSAENFTNEFTTSLLNKTQDKLKAKYRSMDVLLLDDIHFLVDKPKVQEEVFYTFEALFNKKRQLVFTCDRPISELKGIEERLRTRFTRGISINLQIPGYETRCAILQKKIQELEESVPQEVIDYIAKNVQTNIRDLEGCLTTITAYKKLVGKQITVEMCQEHLRDYFSQPYSGSITVDHIIKVVANHYNISLNDIKSDKRTKKILFPRQVAIYIARNLTEFSFPELGDEFGGKDHTTIMHSYSKIENAIKTDSSLNSTIQILIREIKDSKK